MADITRKDWVAKTCEEQVAVADIVFAKLNKASKYAYQPGYTNSFIGVRSGVKPCNFFVVTPQKKATVLSIRVTQSAENDSVANKLSKSGIKYANGWYTISLTSADNIDLAIPVLLQAEAEFKKEKGENALTLHADMPEESAIPSITEAEAEAAKAELARLKAEVAKAQAEAEAAKKAAAKAQADAAKAEKEAAAPIPTAPVASKTSSSKGALNGVFSVAADKKVRFSMGNLQFNPKKYEWRFAEHQWDIIGADNSKIAPNYDGWIDLFGYGTSGYMGCEPIEASEDPNQYPRKNIANTNYDWGMYNPISNGGNKEGLWRTLTSDEWKYLIEKRSNAYKLSAKACINGVNGLVILPDDFYEHRVRIAFDSTPDNYSGNTYDLNQWAILEDAGVIFLPCGGKRLGTRVSSTNLVYWSTTYIYYNNQHKGIGMYVDYDYTIISIGYWGVKCGSSVRLVQDVK